MSLWTWSPTNPRSAALSTSRRSAPIQNRRARGARRRASSSRWRPTPSCGWRAAAGTRSRSRATAGCTRGVGTRTASSAAARAATTRRGRRRCRRSPGCAAAASPPARRTRRRSCGTTGWRVPPAVRCYTWGAHGAGQLGHPSADAHGSPREVDALSELRLAMPTSLEEARATAAGAQLGEPEFEPLACGAAHTALVTADGARLGVGLQRERAEGHQRLSAATAPAPVLALQHMRVAHGGPAARRTRSRSREKARSSPSASTPPASSATAARRTARRRRRRRCGSPPASPPPPSRRARSFRAR